MEDLVLIPFLVERDETLQKLSQVTYAKMIERVAKSSLDQTFQVINKNNSFAPSALNAYRCNLYIVPDHCSVEHLLVISL